MFINYFKTAWRNIAHHKGFSFINITGLAIGLAACILIVQYVSFELSYDTFHKDADNLYRLSSTRIRNGKEDNSAGMAPGIGPLIKANLPAVKAFARYKNMDYMSNQVTFGEIKHVQKNVYFADSNFLTLLNFPAISGQSNHALDEPNTAVLTETAAIKYFGKENPVGKTISMTNEYGTTPYKITALLKDLPGNTHIAFELLLSYKTLIALDEAAKNKVDGWNTFLTYIQLQPGTAAKPFEAQLNKVVKDVLAKDFKEYNYSNTLQLQAVKDIHLHPVALRHDTEIKGNRKTAYILVTVALFILAIAYFNYINLSTSRAINRAKEVGIRKVAGSGRMELIKQFLLESALLNAIALAIAIAIVQLAIPYLNQLTNKGFSFGALFTLNSLWILLALLVAGSLLSGLYPAFVLSSFKPISVLKGKSAKLAQGVWLRKSLVVLQFTASALLIAGTLAVYKQVNYMNNFDLGINIDQTLVVNVPTINEDNAGEKKISFANEVTTLQGVKNVTASTDVPGNEITWVRSIFKTGQDGQRNSYTIHFLRIDSRFLSSYGIPLLEGRNFLTDVPSDRNKDEIILSETALQSFGFKTPQEAIGRQVEDSDNRFYTIVGVTKDFHQNSVKANLKPIAYVRGGVFGNYFSVKIQAANAGDVKTTMAAIETKWKNFFPAVPLDYFFLDEFFNQQYKTDQQFSKIFTLFAALAICIACLGLFGLVSFSTAQRTKEIGIRKVLGASIPGILNMLSKDFIRLIIVANLLAIPLIYLSVNKWLENYPYRIALSWWMFVLPAVLVLLIAMLTVSYQAIKAARANPVKALRYE